MNGRHSGRPTLEEVALRAGVGRGTVSRVINGSPRVSDRAKAAVEAAIAELGYVPNRAARALAGNRTDAIALVIPEPETRLFAEPYFSDIIRGIGAELADTDMQLLLTLIRTPKERARFAQYLAAHRVDGVLLVSVHEDDPLPDLLEQLEMPHGAQRPPQRPGVGLLRRRRQRRRGAGRGRPPDRPRAAAGRHHHRAAGHVRGAQPARRLPAGRRGRRRMVWTPASTPRWWPAATSPRRAAGARCASCWCAVPASTRSSPPPT